MRQCHEPSYIFTSGIGSNPDLLSSLSIIYESFCLNLLIYKQQQRRKIEIKIIKSEVIIT